MRRFRFVVLLAAALALAFPAAAHATDYYVAADGHDTRNTGLQGSPLASVQMAVDNAFASGGGTVYVGPGEFIGNVILRDNVSLRGAGAHQTILRGAAPDRPVIALNSLGGGETISGFTITGGAGERGGGIYCFFSSPVISDNIITGNLARQGAAYYSGSGGGIYCTGGAPTISNNEISENVAYTAGGGIWLEDSSATIRGNTIASNMANGAGSESGSGGGMYVSGGSPLISRNVIADNVATGRDPQGGGIALWWSTATVAVNSITGNTATSGSYYNPKGGGIYCFGAAATISGNDIAENSAFGEMAEGGGIYFYSGMSLVAPAITDNTVRANLAKSTSWYGSARGGGIVLFDGAAIVTGNRITGNIVDAEYAEGGGIYTSAFWNPSMPVIANDIICDNLVAGADPGGSAIYCESSSPRITNTTIVRNGYSGTSPTPAVVTSSFWMASNPLITNCIIWGNLGGSLVGASPTYSCVPGGSTDGNINVDPLLTADYRLSPGSPCIDTASIAVAPTQDILGTPRPQGAGPDMGAHEYLPVLPVPPFAVDDLYTVAEDGTLLVNGRGVLANDSAGYDLVPLSASVAVAPTNGTLALDASGSFTYTPNPGVSGTDTFLYSATDRVGGVDGAWVTIEVAEVDDAPVLGAIGDKSINERVSLVFTASTTDEDTAASGLTYSLGAGAPAGATIHPETGAFSWTPTEAQGPGSYLITVVVSDGTSLDTETIEVTVAEAVSAPVLATIGAQSVAEGSTLSRTASATDEDLPADTLTFSLGAGAPAGATIDPSTGMFSWTPGEADGGGSFDVTVIVSDGALSDSEAFAVTVTEVNDAPGLDAIGDKSVDEGVALTFAASAADADLPANTLTFSLGAGAPTGATIDAATGEFAWTPSETQGPGTHSVEVVVSDGGLTDSETITVSVTEVASAPVLGAIGSKSVNELSPLTFAASASDADWPHDVLSFSLGAGAPAGAAIDAFSGAFTWTPTEEQGPGSYPVTVVVSDGSRTDTETIIVTVAEVTPVPKPTPTGSPSAEAEQPASTTPTATATTQPDESEEEAEVEELLEGDDEATAELVSEGEASEGEDGALLWPWLLLAAVVVLGVVGWLRRPKGVSE